MNKQSYKYYLIILIAFILANCVPSVDNPYNINSDNDKDKPIINIIHPTSGDSIGMGITSIEYQASDYEGGPGLSSYNLFVDGQFIQSFSQNAHGTQPILYFNTDKLENALGIDPYQWPSEISYAITVVNNEDAIGESLLIDSIFIDRKPVAPNPLTLTIITDKSFNLLWDDLASNELKYEVWRQDGGHNTFIHLKDLDANSARFFDYVISDNINYGYKVRATNGYGNSEFSNTVYSSGADGGDAPTNLKIIKFSNTVYSLWWEDNSNDEEGFEIWRKTNYTGTYNFHKKLFPNTTAYNDTVTSGDTYYYKVRAFRTSTSSPFSNEVSTEVFSAPSNLSAQIVNGDNVLLNWTNNGTNEAQIIVERKLQTEFEFSEVTRLAPGTTSWTDQNSLYHNLTLFYRLKTKYPRGDSEYSSELLVFIP